ncbi:hypothetical protein [Agromyces archimandritae]|uniref:Uncharacterized protein n=1 Tax=Agromyces archimandritae TaxID=2781962 RepID=A0A975FPU0_9MICO|nr:hypothetical protein [Agromyces archimandritae]QTX05597.1 hypothetical protein G127AT_05140 [Agromyces archimandritae]
MPQSTNTRARRALRGLFVAGAAVVFASVAHTLGGGRAPGLVVIALTLAAAVPIAMLLARPGRPARRRRTVVAALLAQAALHTLYSLGGGGGGGSGGSRSSGSGGAGTTAELGAATLGAPAASAHVHDPLAGLDAIGGAAPSVSAAGALMLLAHAGAAVLAVVVLLRVDAALDAAAGALRAVVARARPVLAPPPQAAPRAASPAAPRRAHSLVILSAHPHRGPPAFVPAH